MSWGDAVAAEKAVTLILADHAVQVGRIENVAFAHAHLRYGVSFRQGYRKGFREALAWVLHMQAEFAKLPPAQQIEEFDKGPDSLYWPLLRGDEL